jgi:hypothetical protein
LNWQTLIETGQLIIAGDVDDFYWQYPTYVTNLAMTFGAPRSVLVVFSLVNILPVMFSRKVYT